MMISRLLSSMRERKERRGSDRRAPEWHIRDLFCDNHGKLQETKIWSNVGKAIAAGALVWNVHKGTDTEMLWLVVMGVLTAHEAFTRWINSKTGNVNAGIPSPHP